MLALMTNLVSGQTFFNEVECGPEATVFNLFAPANAKSVKVRIYQNGVKGKALKTVKMTYNADTKKWTATVKGDLRGKFYTFDAGHGECAGVFAKAVGVNGRRGAILNMLECDPSPRHLPTW